MKRIHGPEKNSSKTKIPYQNCSPFARSGKKNKNDRYCRAKSKNKGSFFDQPIIMNSLSGKKTRNGSIRKSISKEIGENLRQASRDIDILNSSSYQDLLKEYERVQTLFKDAKENVAK